MKITINVGINEKYYISYLDENHRLYNKTVIPNNKKKIELEINDKNIKYILVLSNKKSLLLSKIMLDWDNEKSLILFESINMNMPMKDYFYYIYDGIVV